MPWMAPIVAYVNDLGYIHCVTCHPDGPGEPIHGDTWFSEQDKCERCGKRLEHVPTDKYVYVPYR